VVDSLYLYEPADPMHQGSPRFLEKIQQEKKDLAGSVISGLTDVLFVSPRFQFKQIRPMDFFLSDTTAMPGLPDWERMQLLCHDSAVDALVVLKYFDLYDPLLMGWNSEDETGSGYYTWVKNSFRIYDPSEMEILDDFTYVDSVYSYSEDDMLEILFNMARNRMAEISDACFWSGQKYAFRITPLWESVYRNYYTWPGDASARARQLVGQGDWLSAAGIWNRESKNIKAKTAAKACYNMALANEVEDNLETALIWAKKADSLLPGKILTTDYIQLLQRRLGERKALNQQMGIKPNDN
jgi:hypothetical protein